MKDITASVTDNVPMTDIEDNNMFDELVGVEAGKALHCITLEMQPLGVYGNLILGHRGEKNKEYLKNKACLKRTIDNIDKYYGQFKDNLALVLEKQK